MTVDFSKAKAPNPFLSLSERTTYLIRQMTRPYLLILFHKVLKIPTCFLKKLQKRQEKFFNKFTLSYHAFIDNYDIIEKT